MAYTQADLDSLTEAIALGAMKVKYADKEVTYRSLKEMKALKRDMEADLAGSNKKSRRRVAIFNRGF